MKAYTRHFLTCAFLASALALGACDSTPPAPKLAHVRTETLSHPIAFGDGNTQIYASERDSLAAFVNNIPSGAVSYVGLATDDTSTRAVARARSVRNYLVARGINQNAIHLQPTKDIDSRTVVLTVEYTKAVPPENCPDWSKNSTFNYENTDASNFGCAYYNNLVVQLADPADYNGAHSTQKIDGARDSVYLQKYLSGSPQSASGGSTSGSSGASSSGSTSTTTSSP